LPYDNSQANSFRLLGDTCALRFSEEWAIGNVIQTRSKIDV
jgi:hypothetical protein